MAGDVSSKDQEPKTLPDDETLPKRPVPEPTLFGQGSSVEREKESKKRFREFWMTSNADGFADDLDQIRKVK